MPFASDFSKAFGSSPANVCKQSVGCLSTAPTPLAAGLLSVTCFLHVASPGGGVELLRCSKAF